jgi:S1-C subfamily serine protease
VPTELPASPALPDERDSIEVIKHLTAAGLTASRAREILLRESALRVEAINAEFAATGTIHPLNGSARSVARQKLRRELGDEVYEKYVEATGRPLRVRVGMIESDSPAANAGLLAGDEIVSYAGRRVFDPGDLTAMSHETSIGETVPTRVVREGQTITLYVTGGPLGISQRAVR